MSGPVNEVSGGDGPLDLLVGCDLGQATDHTAFSVIQRHERMTDQFDERRRRWVTETTYTVPHLERVPLKTPYPVVVESLRGLMAEVQGLRPDRVTLVVDQTGVGRPIVDQMRYRGLSPIPITIVMGTTVSQRPGSIRVPKTDLVTNLTMLLGNGAIRVSEELPEAEALAKELRAFRMKTGQKGHATFEAWREKDHDDLVLAVALPLWWAETRLGSLLGAQLRTPPLSTEDLVRPLTWDEVMAEQGRWERQQASRWKRI